MSAGEYQLPQLTHSWGEFLTYSKNSQVIDSYIGVSCMREGLEEKERFLTKYVSVFRVCRVSMCVCLCWRVCVYVHMCVYVKVKEEINI